MKKQRTRTKEVHADPVESDETVTEIQNLDWMIAVLERVVVLAFALLVLMATAFLIWYGEAKDIPKTRTYVVLKMVHEHWIGALMILVVLFYRPISIYLGRLEKAWGTEAPHKRMVQGRDEGG